MGVMTSKEPAVVIEDLKKDYMVGGQVVNILKGLSVEINKGDFFIIFGPSGCGKSTLLHSILGLEKPTTGKVEVLGNDLCKMSEDEIALFRKQKVGLVFQASYWIKSLTIIENVAFPLFLKGMMPASAAVIAKEKLALMGMDSWADYSPGELSSGQQQKVGLARALVVDPEMIVADEPTGNLDSTSGDELMNLLKKLNEEQGKTIIMVTHDLEYLKYSNRAIHIIDGNLVDEFNESNRDKLTGHMISKRGNDAQRIESQVILGNGETAKK